METAARLAGPPPKAGAAGGPGPAWITALAAASAALASLLPNPGAALPLRTYFFRDFTVTFYPQRLFAAREWAAGRWPLWNPFVHEGEFALPVLYPPELLHVLWPDPAHVSWLLTLHLPLAALAMFLLGRDLGFGRLGALCSALAFATGGLALSTLDLYVFLQALAWAPLVVLALRRAALEGRRWVAAAAAVVAVSLTTLAVEFVAQALVLGLALALAEATRRRPALARLAAALALGLGMAAVPVAVILGLMGETVRGAGFERSVALANELHPLGLLQVLVPDLFGPLSAPVELYWGGPFFTKGFPYFLSIHLGALVLAAAVAGATGSAPRWRRVVLVLAVLGLWYALGARGGLAWVASHLPLASWFRFPSKALLLPHLGVALLAGRGVDRLVRGEGWPAFAAGAAGAAAVALALAATLTVAAAGVGRVLGLPPWFAQLGAPHVARDALVVLLCAAAGLAVAWLVRGARVAAPWGAALVVALSAFELLRAGRGMNPQTTPRFFAPLPEMEALALDRLGGGRVFTYGADWSPAFRSFLAQPGEKALRSFFVVRHLLSPYANVVDRVELAQAKDVTSFATRPQELTPADYDPAAVGRILPRLRAAAVSRVISLDPLADPALRALAAVPTGVAGLSIHVYEVDPWPRAFVACRAAAAADPFRAYWASLEPAFEPVRDVVLESPGTADCRQGTVQPIEAEPLAETYGLELDGHGYLVVRSSYARGWRATVDGRPTPVLRANGKHRALPLGPGRHRVEFQYVAPGLRAGLVLAGLSALTTMAWCLRARPRAA